jgi:hypothetical protein
MHSAAAEKQHRGGQDSLNSVREGKKCRFTCILPILLTLHEGVPLNEAHLEPVRTSNLIGYWNNSSRFLLRKQEQ